jgi:hypothetical protein
MTVYEKVVSISKVYLGPAAEAFIARQCKSHLNKEPRQLAQNDLADLAKWMEIGVRLLLTDRVKSAELANKVRTA